MRKIQPSSVLLLSSDGLFPCFSEFPGAAVLEVSQRHLSTPRDMFKSAQMKTLQDFTSDGQISCF